MEALVVLPGILGSKLASSSGEQVWPPTPIEVVAGYRRIDKLLDPNLRVTGIIEKVCIDVYGSLLEALRDLGYSTGSSSLLLVEHAYDWRRNILDAATELDRRLTGLVETHGEGLQIKLVCHSMGGLVARACLERHRNVTPVWHRAVKLLVFLATPHEGAPLAFARATGSGGASLGLSARDLRRLCEAAGYPADYQLFPPARLEPVWDLEDPIPYRPRSLFDPEIVRAYGLNVDHLGEASELEATLDFRNRPPGCRYFAIVSAAHETLTRFDQDLGEGRPVKVESTGDGTVPIQSAAALPIQTAFVDANHLGVAQKSATHKLLGILLGRRPPEPIAAFTDARDHPVFSLSNSAIEEGEPYEIVITLPEVSEIDATILVLRGDAAEPAASVPVSLKAPDALRLVLRGPRLAPGQYVFALMTGGERVDENELVVTKRSTS